jgi:hypothetical protein
MARISNSISDLSDEARVKTPLGRVDPRPLSSSHGDDFLIICGILFRDSRDAIFTCGDIGLTFPVAPDRLHYNYSEIGFLTVNDPNPVPSQRRIHIALTRENHSLPREKRPRFSSFP